VEEEEDGDVNKWGEGFHIIICGYHHSVILRELTS
jgi:hypothetical protein